MAASGSVTEVSELVMERVLDAPRERVFEMFTKAEHLQKWWGPKKVGIATVEFDARVGGEMFLAERGSDGTMHYFAGSVREIVPPSRIVIAFHTVDADRKRVGLAWAAIPEGWQGEIVQDVTLIAEGQRTRVRIRITGFPSAQWGEMAKLGQAENFDRLEWAVRDDMTVTPAGERDIVITRTFNAPRALVYEALTKAEHVKKWWGPRQYGPVSATADFRSGGTYRFAQGSPQGEVAFRGEVREATLDRIVYTEEFEAMPGHVAVTTATLEEHGGKTRMTVRTTFASAQDRDGMLKSGMEWGARLSYLQLDEVLEDLAA